MISKVIKLSELPSVARASMYDTDTRLRQRLNESSGVAVSDYKRFDVFLSHSHVDDEIILRFHRYLTSLGLSVYVDWIIDKNEDGKPITVQNADLIRKRMKQCVRMFYVHTLNATTSKWCPWEIGYFDGLGREVLIAFVSETERRHTGQEYLDLYPRLYMGSHLRAKSSLKKETHTSVGKVYS